MINIDGIFYNGSLSKSKVLINNKWEDVLVLDIDADLEDINIIKYQNEVYKIDKIINRFEDNKKWLTYIYESPDIEKIELDKLKEENENLKLSIGAATMEVYKTLSLMEEQNKLENAKNIMDILELIKVMGGDQ